jgi:hypothetical protein
MMACTSSPDRSTMMTPFRPAGLRSEPHTAGLNECGRKQLPQAFTCTRQDSNLWPQAPQENGRVVKSPGQHMEVVLSDFHPIYDPVLQEQGHRRGGRPMRSKVRLTSTLQCELIQAALRDYAKPATSWKRILDKSVQPIAMGPALRTRRDPAAVQQRAECWHTPRSAAAIAGCSEPMRRREGRSN